MAESALGISNTMDQIYSDDKKGRQKLIVFFYITNAVGGNSSYFYIKLIENSMYNFIDLHYGTMKTIYQFISKYTTTLELVE